MDEDFSSHRDFGTVGYLGDVLSAPFLINANYTKDLYKAFQVRYMYFQDGIMDVLSEQPHFKKHLNYSHLSLFDKIAPLSDLEKHLAYRKEQVKALNPGPIRDYRLRFPKYYLEKIAELCRKNNVRLIFLYIPSYGMVSEEPFEIDYYRNMADLLLPPPPLFRDPKLWMDTEHFNAMGARKFSAWLAAELGK